MKEKGGGAESATCLILQVTLVAVNLPQVFFYQMALVINSNAAPMGRLCEHAELGRASEGSRFAKNFKGSLNSSNVTMRLLRSKYSEVFLRSSPIYLDVPVYLLWEKEAWCSHNPRGYAFDVKNIDIPRKRVQVVSLRIIKVRSNEGLKTKPRVELSSPLTTNAC